MYVAGSLLCPHLSCPLQCRAELKGTVCGFCPFLTPTMLMVKESPSCLIYRISHTNDVNGQGGSQLSHTASATVSRGQRDIKGRAEPTLPTLASS